MNILHIEEMIEAEKALLSAPPHEKYRLNLPDAQEVARFATSSPHLWGAPSPTCHHEVDKLLTHTKSLKCIKQADPNATIKLFSCAVLSIIYPSANPHRSAPTNNLLLETLKCTLYSSDLALPLIKNMELQLDNLQAKAMIARFFDVLATQKEAMGSSFAKYVDLFLQTNHILLDIFAAFYRLVLSKLTFDKAEDFLAELTFQEVLINLAEYFDISYRNRAHLFLLYQENIFLALASDEVVLGEYMDNQLDLKEISFKDSRGFNLMQSFLLRSSQKQCRQKAPERQPKSFNFCFESGEFRCLKGDYDHEKSIDLETPHFNESTEFVFGRKKKQEDAVIKQQEIKKEISKINLNASIESLKDFNFNECMAILKSIEEKQTLLNNQLQNTKLRHLQDKDKQILVTPINQLDEILEQSKVSVDRGRNIVNVKDKKQTVLTPQVSSSPQSFTQLEKDAIFLKQSNDHPRKQSSQANFPMDDVRTDFHPYSDCKCRVYRISRNNIASTVVSLSYIPADGKKKDLKPPSFINHLTYSQKLAHCKSSRVHSPRVKRLMTLEQKPIQQAKEVRKPAFLKCLKKNKEQVEKQSQSSFAKSKKSKQSQLSNRKHSMNYERVGFDASHKKEAMKMDHNKERNHDRLRDFQFRETLRKNDYHHYIPQKKPIQNNTVLKKFDTHNLFYRPALGNNWQSSSNFHQYSQQTPHKLPGDHCNTTAPNSDKITRLYAPTVHIIAPTVYLHSNAQQNSAASCKEDFSPQGSEKTDLKDSHRILKTQSSIHIKQDCK